MLSQHKDVHLIPGDWPGRFAFGVALIVGETMGIHVVLQVLPRTFFCAPGMGALLEVQVLP